MKQPALLLAVLGLVVSAGCAGVPASAPPEPVRGASTSVRAVPAADTSYAPSGQRMPLYKKGWRRVFAEDFRQPVARGSFPGTVYGAKWRVYPDGWKDTTKRGTYAPSRVLSVHGGLLDYYLHSSGGQHLVAAALPKTEAGAYGRYAVRFRADRRMRGYKTAWLLWPDSKKWPEGGEIDWPEGNLDGTSISAFMHYARARGRAGRASTPRRALPTVAHGRHRVATRPGGLLPGRPAHRPDPHSGSRGARCTGCCRPRPRPTAASRRTPPAATCTSTGRSPGAG